MPAELRERVFERFARGSGDSSATAGSGLGLAIVRAVVDAHGGAVELDEAPGGGARLLVTLPALPAGAEPAATPPPRRAAPSGGA